MTTPKLTMVRWLARGAEGAIALYWLWAAVTAAVITLSLGQPVLASYTFSGITFDFSTTGIAGEQYYPGWLLGVTFLNRLMFLYAFYRLWRLFGAFVEKRYFAAETIGHLLAFTGWFTLFTLSRLGIELFFLTFLKESIPAGARVTITFNDLGDLGYPILFFLIAHILNEARQNEEELERYF